MTVTKCGTAVPAEPVMVEDNNRTDVTDTFVTVVTTQETESKMISVWLNFRLEVVGSASL